MNEIDDRDHAVLNRVQDLLNKERAGTKAALNNADERLARLEEMAAAVERVAAFSTVQKPVIQESVGNTVKLAAGMSVVPKHPVGLTQTESLDALRFAAPSIISTMKEVIPGEAGELAAIALLGQAARGIEDAYRLGVVEAPSQWKRNLAIAGAVTGVAVLAGAALYAYTGTEEEAGGSE